MNELNSFRDNIFLIEGNAKMDWALKPFRL
jgi:hypothetical protein